MKKSTINIEMAEMKMKISSVICEYNPFHNGHEYMLRKMREGGATHIIACMSGNFTQRGIPAVYDKFTRAKAALLCGADLVTELPVSFACAGAEHFAFGGVSVLNSLGCVDELCFGSESGNIGLLKKTAEYITDDCVCESLKKYLAQGMTFAAARQNAAAELYGEECATMLTSPNDILGIEYIKALNQLKSRMVPKTIQRQGAAHDSEKADGNTASAMYIRRLIQCGDDLFAQLMPGRAFDVFMSSKNQPPECGRHTKLEGFMLYRLRTMTQRQIAQLPEVSEGLENRIFQAVRTACSIEEVINRTKTKRYTYARIRRILNYALLGITKQDYSMPVQYIRILGFNERGREILKSAKKTSSLPIIMRYADIRQPGTDAVRMFDLESRADDIYSMSGEKIFPCGTNMTAKPVIL